MTGEHRADEDERLRRENQRWAGTLMEELVRGGVRVIVVAPGSRSSPLVFAAARNDAIRTLVQLDERSAGFLALGVGKATGRPAAVITTSGTAVANLLPAVVEASQSEAPLILLTADRPPRLRGTDANQTIHQPGIYGRYVRHMQELFPAGLDLRTLQHLRASVARAVGEAVGDPAGPVHLNLPFEKPLEPLPSGTRSRADSDRDEGPRNAGAPWTVSSPRRALPDPETLRELGRAIRGSRSPLLIAGRLPRPSSAGPALAEFAGTVGAPLLADALSGARFVPGGGALGGYDLVLGSARAIDELRPDLVIRFGASATSTRLGAYLEGLRDVKQVVVDGGGRWKDHLSIAHRMVRGDPEGVVASVAGMWETLEGVDESGARSRWLARWRALEARVGEGVRTALLDHPCEGSVLAEVVRRIPDDDVLFVSSSMPVRDLDTFGLPALRKGRGAPLLVLGNRGASGIDGIVSTAIGAGVGSGRAVTAVVGDLALIHDINGLVALREAGIRLTLVVINNDGGGIFHLLPVRELEPEFTRFFATPHGLEPGRVAALHDLPHERVGLEGLDGALSRAWSGVESAMIEVRTDREMNRQARSAVLQSVRDALDSGFALDETE